MPPIRSGIAACSAELVAALGAEHQIDVYVDEPVARAGSGVKSAHEFVWRHRREPYDLTVYQVGNSSHHDYLWPYLFRYPGLAVLHDAHLHHARAAALLRTGRAADYRSEFAANHPEVSPDLAELAIAGFDNHLYYAWPMTRLVVEASRLAVVHTPSIAAAIREELPAARVDSVRLAHGEVVSAEREQAARARVRAALGIREDAVLFGVFGALTPDKRVAQVLGALAAVVPDVPSAHLLLAGAPVRYYDVAADVRTRGLDAHVTLTGYLETDAELTDCIAACDIALTLRWPTAREVSGPWLRCLAAARPTIIIDLAHLDVPSLDPRTWTVNIPATGDSRLDTRTGLPSVGSDFADRGPRIADRDDVAPVTVAIDILDEDHSLRLAMRRLAWNPGLRRRIGAAGRRYWEREHSPSGMLEDYRRVLHAAASQPPPDVALPPHLVTDGDARLRGILAEVGLAGDIWHSPGALRYLG